MADHGYAPYQESAFRSALRLLGAAGRGAASVPGLVDPQSSGFGNALQGFGGGFGSEIKASSAARLVAQQYAEKRHAEERQARMDAENSAFKQAEIKRMEIPPKPEKHVPTMAEKRAEAEAMLGRRLTDEEARKLAGVHFNPPKTAAGAVPKPPKIRTAVQKVLDLISTADVNNPAHRSKLQQWLANPLSPEVAAAAAAKLTVPGTGGAMRR